MKSAVVHSKRRVKMKKSHFIVPNSATSETRKICSEIENTNGSPYGALRHFETKNTTKIVIPSYTKSLGKPKFFRTQKGPYTFFPQCPTIFYDQKLFVEKTKTFSKHRCPPLVYRALVAPTWAVTQLVYSNVQFSLAE